MESEPEKNDASKPDDEPREAPASEAAPARVDAEPVARGGRGPVVLLGVLAFAALVATAWLLLHANPKPVVFTEQRVRLAFTDTTRQVQATELPPGFRGPIKLPVDDVRCSVAGPADIAIVRCERAGVWSSIQVACEHYEVGLFAREHALTIGAKDAPYVIEINVQCAYAR